MRPLGLAPVTELKLAVIPGDGIGTEVVAEGLKVLSAVAPSVGLSVSATEYDLGARRYNATGETLPVSVLDELRGHDAILLGAIGDPSVPPGVLERGVLLGDLAQGWTRSPGSTGVVLAYGSVTPQELAIALDVLG